jgi:pilus assembly protein FimV
VNKKALSLAICAALALPTVTGALTLGEIESNSHLNQPFRGKINLHSTNIAEAKTLRVRIAPPAVFNRVGIDRPKFLNGIRFNTTVQNGKPVILVSSNYPINEPFLNFLLEISWPNGKLLKEYTVLLDPPVLMTPNTAIASNTAGVRAEPQARVNQAQTDNQKLYRDAQRALQQPRRVVRASQNQRSTARRVRPQVRRVAASQVRTYRVKRGDTLHKIAKRIGYRGVSTDQMMLALYKKNKRAFVKHNMNNLKAGVVLQRPSAAHAKSVSRSEARKVRISQARAWKKANGTAIAKNSSSTKQASKSSQARIEVSGKTDVLSGKAAALAASGKASVDELRKQLVMTSEALQSRRKENQELQSRVSEMESLLRKKNRLISMKSQQLAKLQGSLSGKPVKTEGADIEATVKEQAEGKGAGTIVRPSTPEASAQAINSKVDEVAKAAEEKVQASLLAAQKKAEDAKVKAENIAQQKLEQVKTKINTEEKPEGIMGNIMGLMDSPDALKYGAGGGAALALLGGFWFMRRRNAYKEFSAEDYSEDSFNEDNPTDFADVDADNSVNELNTELASSEFTNDIHTVSEDADNIATENAEDDLLQEADVYIVYGLYDQAESELKEAIDKSPNNLAYRKKLLESYKASGDKSAFEQEAKKFKALDVAGKDEHWEDICEWGHALVPDSNLFVADSSSSVAKGVAAASVAMVAGTAIAESDNGDNLEDLLGSDDPVDEFDNINLDDLLSDDVDETSFSTDSGVENVEIEAMDALDLSAEPDFGDFDKDSFDTTNDLDDSLESLLDEAVEEPVVDLEMPSMDLNLDSDEAIEKIATQDTKEEGLLTDFDDNLSFLDLDDEVIEETEIGTKIDLAKAYIDMGDIDGARSTLEEVMQEGSDEQKLEAEELMQHTG